MDAFCYMQTLSVHLMVFLMILKQNVHMDIVVTPPLHTLPVAVTGRQNAAS